MKNRIYNIMAIIYPLILGIVLLSYNSNLVLELSNAKFIINFGSDYKLIALGFSIIAIAANLYAESDKLLIKIIGNIYSTAAIICVLVEDLVSMFIALEIMMICSCILIFKGSSVFHENSIRATKQYILTHIFSGSLVLICISYIITHIHSTEIINLTSFIQNKDQGFILYALLLTGMLINIAAFPFSGWMVNCYPVASNCGFIYLISFTTKVSVILLIKLFSGFEALKIFGIVMLLYGGIYACIENNLKKLLCYLNISQLGFIIISISLDMGITNEIITYIFIHILYNGLLSLIVIMFDENQISDCSNICKVKNPIILVSMVLGIFMITSMPLSAGFVMKTKFSDFLPEIINNLISLFNVLLFIALPIRGYFAAKNSYNLKIENTKTLSFLVIVSALVLTNAYLLSNTNVELQDLVGQLIIVMVGALSCYLIRLPRVRTVVINFDLPHIIGNSFYHLINRSLRKEEKIKKVNWFIAVEQEFLKKLSTIHNQRISIFAVLLLLIILLMTFANRS